MRTEARRLRLQYSPKDTFELLDEPFSLLRWTRHAYGEIDNVLSGSWRDVEVRAFDYAYAQSENEQRRLSCVLVAIPGGWPAMVIRPESRVTRLADHLALPGIEFEWEEFNLAYDVRCEDRRFASAVVDARMMQWLLTLGHGWGFEVHGRWILGYRDQVQPWELAGVLATLVAFIGRIPNAARSLYPERLPHRPDVSA
jgi:hypothetical protein